LSADAPATILRAYAHPSLGARQLMLVDGEIRLTHPLNAHLAHTAALWRQLSEPVADWLKESFTRAADLQTRLQNYSFT